MKARYAARVGSREAVLEVKHRLWGVPWQNLLRSFARSFWAVGPVRFFSRKIYLEEISPLPGRTWPAAAVTAGLFLLVAGAYFLLGGRMLHPDAPPVIAQPALYVPARIDSFSIEPSRRERGWTVYPAGAKAVLRGRGLAEVQIRHSPTGMSGASPAGAVLGEAVRSGVRDDADIWIFTLPSHIRSTNLWVVVKDMSGRTLRGPDLGNVAFEE